MFSRLLRRLRALVPAAAAALLTSVSAWMPAQAALYVGTWDPRFGAPFAADLGWRGTIEFDVPLAPDCATDGAACIAGSKLLSAQVEFYDTDAPATTLATIDWTLSELASTSILGLRFGPGGDVLQLATQLSPYKAPNAGLAAFGVDAGTEFGLQFVIDQRLGDGSLFSGPRLFWRRICSSYPGDRGGYGYGGDDDDDGESCTPGQGGNDALNFPPQDFIIRRTDQPVPEPGALVLVISALGALALVSRRSPRRR